MGQEILYCFKCSTQLREAQFEKGKAFRVDAWVTCSTCAPELLKTLPPDRVQVLLNLMAGKDRKPAAVTPPSVRDSRLGMDDRAGRLQRAGACRLAWLAPAVATLRLVARALVGGLLARVFEAIAGVVFRGGDYFGRTVRSYQYER